MSIWCGLCQGKGDLIKLNSSSQDKEPFIWTAAAGFPDCILLNIWPQLTEPLWSMGQSNDTHTQLCVCVLCPCMCIHMYIFMYVCSLSLVFPFPSPLCSSVSLTPFLPPSLLFSPSLPSSTPSLAEVNLA